MILLLVATICRLYLCDQFPLLPDEAYYYLWSQHLAASYFSKGPAIAYTIAASTTFFGHNAFGVRFFSVLLSAGIAWQLFLLARRWFNEEIGLIAVLLASVVPLYATGAILMTIDPLSAFFWLLAVNFFSRSLEKNKTIDWIGTGVAVGCGFLAKFLNGLELLAFLGFLISVPRRRTLLKEQGFWLMLAVSILCTLPVWWWNIDHGWPTMHHLLHRGNLNEPFTLHPQFFLSFLLQQAVVISPVLFLSLIYLAGFLFFKLIRRKASEAEVLFLMLFVSVFVFYAVLAWHSSEEPNWPAISYLSLIIVSASWASDWLRNHKAGHTWLIALFLVGWSETILLHSTAFLPLPGRLDPMSRVAGWREIAAHLGEVQRAQHAQVLLTDAYKEASILSFYLPNHAFVYTKKAAAPESEFYFWPGYSTTETCLYITYHQDGSALADQFNTITWLDRIIVYYRGTKLREYNIFRCENR